MRFLSRSRGTTFDCGCGKKLIHLSVDKREEMSYQSKTFYFEKLSLRVGVAAFVDIFKQMGCKPAHISTQ